MINTIKKILKKIKDIIVKINNKYEKIITTGKQKYFFQFFPKNIVLLCLFICLVSLFVGKIKDNDVVLLNTSRDFATYNPVMNEKVKAILPSTELKKITKAEYLGIYFTTHGRINDSLYCLRIYENDKVIYKKYYNTRNIKTDKITKFKINNIKFDYKKKYKVELETKRIDYYNNISIYRDVNTKEMQVLLINKSPYYNTVIIIAILFSLLYFFINYLINNNKIRSEIGCYLILLLYIIPILFIIPPYQVPDEPYHFFESYNLATYKFNQKIGKALSSRTINAPKNIDCLNYSNIQGTDNVSNGNSIKKCFKDEHKYTKYIAPATMNSANTLYYLPSGIIIKLFLLFTQNPIIIFYCGRITNFIISCLILLKAIKTTPKYKTLFLCVGCLPVFIQQIVSYSYDGLLNSCALLAVAYFIKYYTSRKKLEFKDIIPFIIVSCVLLYLKRVYYIIVPFILLVPNKNFKNGLKDKIKYMIYLVIVPTLILVVSNLLFSIGTPVLETASNDINSVLQMKRIISNPISLPIVILRTLKKFLNNYITELVGILGWLKYIMPAIIVKSYYILLVVLLLSFKSIFKNIKEKVFILLLVLMSLGMIFIVMYLSWTKVGAPYAIGIQGRYFIPLLIPTLICFIPKKNLIKIKNNTVYSFLNIMLLSLIVFIMISYY